MSAGNLLREYHTVYKFEDPNFADFSLTFLGEMQDAITTFGSDLTVATDVSARRFPKCPWNFCNLALCSCCCRLSSALCSSSLGRSVPT